jgi:hypothetical protein
MDLKKIDKDVKGDEFNTGAKSAHYNEFKYLLSEDVSNEFQNV